MKVIPEKKKQVQKSYKTWLGVLAGIIGPIAGAYVYYISHPSLNHYTLHRFIRLAYKMDILSAILSIGAFVNLILFFLFIQIKWNKAAKAVLIVSSGYVVLVLFLKFIL